MLHKPTTIQWHLTHICLSFSWVCDLAEMSSLRLWFDWLGWRSHLVSFHPTCLYIPLGSAASKDIFFLWCWQECQGVRRPTWCLSRSGLELTDCHFRLCFLDQTSPVAKPTISGYGKNTRPTSVYCKVTWQGEVENYSRSQYKQCIITKFKT